MMRVKVKPELLRWARERGGCYFSIAGNTVSLFTKKPWAEDKSFTVETEVARFRYHKEQRVWELFCEDRSGRWCRPKGTRPDRSIMPLLAKLKDT